MNKQEFLEKLEKELSILNKQERKDIIDEYKDTIEEKVKHGQTEEDAVKDFGNLDELVSGILDAYKINPEYNQKESNFGKFTEEGEKLIKKGANKLADMTRDFANNIKENDAESNLNLAFEIIIKIFCTLIIFAVLTIPFRFFKNLGFSFAETFFTPISGLVKIFILLLFIALYLGIALLIIVALFKEYFKKNSEPQEIKNQETNQTKETKINSRPVKRNNKNGPTIGSVLLLIVKIWVVILILLPLFFLDALVIFGLFVTVFYWIKGINLFGLTVLLLGISSLFIWFTILIYNLTFSKGKVSIIPFFIGLAISIFGAMFFIDMITSIEYINKPSDNFQTKTETQTFNADKNIYINFNLNGDLTKKVDETLPDNTFKITYTYYQDSDKIEIYNEPNYHFQSYACESPNEKHLCKKPYNYISFSYEYNSDYNSEKKRYNDFIDNLKDGKIYNYDKLNNVNVEISANSNTMKNIEP